jgi:pimeloyl-ACP methyl ester carboxylesterase
MKFIKRFFQILLVVIVVAVIGFTVFWFSRPADVSFDDHKEEIPFAKYSKFAEINGVKLHYQEKGEGTPLVLIHGYTSLHYTWNDVFEPLSKKFRVIAVDLKGFGFSDKPDGDYTRREQAKLVRGLLDHLKIEKTWLAGSSMGGEVSLNVALQSPERVAGLILIDSAGVKFESRSRSSSEAFKIPFLGRAFAALALLSEDTIRDGLRRSYFDRSKITDKTVRMYHLPLTGNNGQRAAALASQQWDFYSIEGGLGKINVPALIIWGAEDEVIPLGTGRKMNSLIKNSELKVYENTGHLPQEEVPQRVVEDILDFIDH